ncbi:hypothetical protein L7F22_004637 [Adiantum nelumboides]|nr:hypothetical protein [Adiantum nelumboides]
MLLFLSPASSATTLKAKDEYRIACGALSNLSFLQGCVWTGDASNAASGNPYLNFQNSSLQDLVPPFSSTRIFTSQATYFFPVSPGRHWIRLYFYPASSTYNVLDAVLTVQMDAYTLNQNVSLLSYVMSALILD